MTASLNLDREIGSLLDHVIGKLIKIPREISRLHCGLLLHALHFFLESLGRLLLSEDGAVHARHVHPLVPLSYRMLILANEFHVLDLVLLKAVKKLLVAPECDAPELEIVPVLVVYFLGIALTLGAARKIQVVD